MFYVCFSEIRTTETRQTTINDWNVRLYIYRHKHVNVTPIEWIKGRGCRYKLCWKVDVSNACIGCVFPGLWV